MSFSSLIDNDEQVFTVWLAKLHSLLYISGLLDQQWPWPPAAKYKLEVEVSTSFRCQIIEVYWNRVPFNRFRSPHIILHNKIVSIHRNHSLVGRCFCIVFFCQREEGLMTASLELLEPWKSFHPARNVSSTRGCVGTKEHWRWGRWQRQECQQTIFTRGATALIWREQWAFRSLGIDLVLKNSLLKGVEVCKILGNSNVGPRNEGRVRMSSKQWELARQSFCVPRAIPGGMRSQFSIESVQMHAMDSMVAEEKLGKEFFRQEMFLKGKDM